MLLFKKIFISFITLILLSSYSYSEIIKTVEINGNERISNETILIFGDVTIGKEYKKNDVNILIKKLYESDFFSDIEVLIKDEKLLITVKENPIINSIVFNGEKAEKYKEKISELLTLREKSSFKDDNIKSDINLIKDFYRSLGHYFVKIDGEVVRLQKNRVNLIYTIEKGDKAKIAKINFLGDKKIRERKLRDIITSQENRMWKFISQNIYLNQTRIDLDKRLLENYYKNKGYYEVLIKSTNVEYADGEGFILTYNINAGKRYKFKKIYANIAETLDNEAFLSLENDFSKLIGDYYSQKKLQSLLVKIDKLSEQKELQFINHNVYETLEGNGVEVKINIFEGEKVIIERINIVGNSVTNDSVIRGTLVVDEGDPYSVLLINKSINEIKARNLFGVVEHKVLPGSTKDLKILQIRVEEKATGEIMAGAGIGTDGTSFQFAVSENNWLGRGISLDSTLNLSEAKVSGNLAVENPNYNFSGNSVNAELDVSATNRSNTSGFKSSKTGFLIGTKFEQYEKVFIQPNFAVAFEDIEVEDTASSSIKKMKGNFFNADLGYAVIFDKRNQAFKPTDGYKATFKQSLPVVQDSSSIMNSIEFSNYHEFSDDFIGSFKFYGKTITGVDDDVRLTNRIYIPRQRLRGFNILKVGPKDGDDYIGGNYVTSFTTEAQLPNLLPESYRTDFSVFFDAGNVWGVDYSNSVDETNEIRSSIGIGANLFTPIGPLTFTLAQSLTQATTDETETFNFRLGTSF